MNPPIDAWSGMFALVAATSFAASCGSWVALVVWGVR